MVQWLMAVQACPFPEYPLLQVQLNVPGPVEVQVDPTAQLLIPKVQLFMGVQAYPVPLYPLLQVHVNISVAVELQVDPVAEQLLYPLVQLFWLMAIQIKIKIKIKERRLKKEDKRGSETIPVQKVPLPVKSEVHAQL